MNYKFATTQRTKDFFLGHDDVKTRHDDINNSIMRIGPKFTLRTTSHFDFRYYLIIQSSSGHKDIPERPLSNFNYLSILKKGTNQMISNNTSRHRACALEMGFSRKIFYPTWWECKFFFKLTPWILSGSSSLISLTEGHRFFLEKPN